MKSVLIHLDEEEHRELNQLKGKLSWKDAIIKSIKKVFGGNQNE